MNLTAKSYAQLASKSTSGANRIGIATILGMSSMLYMPPELYDNPDAEESLRVQKAGHGYEIHGVVQSSNGSITFKSYVPTDGEIITSLEGIRSLMLTNLEELDANAKSTLYENLWDLYI